MTNDCFQRLILSGALLLLPATVLAQSVSTGSITGVVRDTSGAVLPGVTVEAASPALIEKVRSAVSDSSGVYRITDLRPAPIRSRSRSPGSAPCAVRTSS